MSSLLRADLLAGRHIAVVGSSPLAAAIATCCERLGGAVQTLDRPNAEWPSTDLDIDALVCDGGALFGAAPAGIAALRACADGCFSAVSALGRALIAAQRPGRLVVIAPPPGAGPHAAAACAALENLARTLSVEWSGRGIGIVAVAPGDAAPAADVAQVVAFTLADAARYCTGTLLDLRAAA